MVLTITKLVTSNQSVICITSLKLGKFNLRKFLHLVSLYN